MYSGGGGDFVRGQFPGGHFAFQIGDEISLRNLARKSGFLTAVMTRDLPASVPVCFALAPFRGDKYMVGIPPSHIQPTSQQQQHQVQSRSP